ncbi:VOC family protein [Roseicella aerolata]|uniref:VOC family protein n=1 Tax=Roseicella aerolata TaxID=2883479 RepID=A0A9X1IB67_9PROT|nr:VOC family protein [Roseicella aerolata]MCB4820533.1 VOC family protein [Roseicella aerolata]
MQGMPLAQDITQVGIVVRDLDRALAEYTHKLGVGPWRVYTYAPPRLTDMRIRGVGTPYSMKLALAWTKGMMWELIQPLDGPSIYKEFLRDHGEGIHHVMVDYGDRTLGQVKAEFAARGWPVLMEGNYLGSQFAYFETEGSLTTTIEVRYSAPGWQRPEPESWYPAAR